MKWIFSNEDKVWRDRGGRPGEETLTSFLNFILPEEKGEPLNAAITTNTSNATADTTTATPTAPTSTSQSVPTSNDLDPNTISQPTVPEPASETQQHPPVHDSQSQPTQPPPPQASKPNHFGHLPFGGYVVLSSNQTELMEDGKLKLTTNLPDIVSYAIGDFIAADKYEIVTGMHFFIDFYFIFFSFLVF
jgi:hypothetical protein